MENNKQLMEFLYNGKMQVRVIMRNREPWFVAKDVCDVLDIANSRDAVGRLDDDEKDVVSTDTLGGEQKVQAVNEPGLYTLILGSRKPEAKAFKRWITHEIIPSIRRTGTYSLQSQAISTYNLPQTYKEALLALVAEVEKTEQLEADKLMLQQCLAEAQPKVTYVDRILDSKDTLLITQIAKDYGMSGRRLNTILHSEGVQYKLHDQWVLYWQYQDLGYTKSHTHEFTRSSGEKGTKITTEWTQKGRLFIHELLSKRGIVATMDKPREANKSADIIPMPTNSK